MSIQTEITRINHAKTDIVSAITEKGGTVADGAKIEDLPACIRAIPAGGGGGETAYLKVSSPVRAKAVIILSGRTIDATEPLEDEIECTVGDLAGIVCAYNYRVTVEFGCEITYQTYAGSGAVGKSISFVTITDAAAAVNVGIK